MAGSPESPGTDVQACLVGLVGRGRKLLSGHRLEARYRFNAHVMTHLSKKAREKILDLVVPKCVESTISAGHDVVHFRQRALHNGNVRALDGVASRI